MKALAAAGLLLFALAISALLGEGLVRLFLPEWAPRTAEISSYWTHDSGLGWSHIPNAKGPFNVLGNETLISINSKGFRDVERSYERNSKYRIVVLGDSMVWGYGVQQEEVFTSLLEKRLPGLEAVNLGVSGYGTDQELILLQREGVRYRPNLFMVVIAYNDLQTNVQKKAYLAYQKPMFELSGSGDLKLTNTPVPKQTLFEQVALGLMRHSYVLNKAASVYHYFTLASVSQGGTPAKAAKERPFPRTPAEAVTVAMLLEMEKTARTANADFVLVVADGLGRIGRGMEEFFRARNIRILNMDHEFPSSDSQGLHLQDGVHWNAPGHRKVADRLERYLREERLIR